MKTPVAFIIFKRPDTTKQVFEAIRQAKPPKLLVIADGARENQPEEAEKCAATRAIIDRVDWDCEVLKNFADENMGCRNRVSSGLDWVFETVEEAIILEDDCVPNPSFFIFCEELLEKYRDDRRIMTICGTNVLGEWKSDLQSYFFSSYYSCWGWATWKRAWNYYDVEMKLWSNPDIKKRVREILANDQQYRIWKKLFDNVRQADTWDFQWFLSYILQSGLVIIPSVNLVSNIGFSAEATHTKEKDIRANLTSNTMSFPLKEPLCIVRDREYETVRSKKMSVINSLSRRIYLKTKKTFVNINKAIRMTSRKL